MTNKMTASMLLGELTARGPVIEPMRDGMRLTDIAISEKEGRPIAVFTYDTGRKATLGVGDGECGIAGFVMDGVVIAYARMSFQAGREIGLELTSRAALAQTGVQIVASIERLMPADIARCVGPVVDMVALDAAPRYESVIPSLTSDELAIARSGTWTPEGRYRRFAQAECDERFADAKTAAESRRNPNYVPAWGVGAAAADTAPTPRGRVPLGRLARR